MSVDRHDFHQRYEPDRVGHADVSGGLEFDFSQLKSPENKRAVGFISVLGIALPFMPGVGIRVWVRASSRRRNFRAGYALFIATAFSITAVPILGRIMMEFDLTRTQIGVITASSAAVNGAVGWMLLAFISAAVTAHFSVAGSWRSSVCCHFTSSYACTRCAEARNIAVMMNTA